MHLKVILLKCGKSGRNSLLISKDNPFAFVQKNDSNIIGRSKSVLYDEFPSCDYKNQVNTSNGKLQTFNLAYT